MDVPYIDKVQAILQNFISQENFILHFEDKKTVFVSVFSGFYNLTTRADVFSFQCHILV